MSVKSHHHALEWLRAADVRPTRQRQVLAELLVADGQNRHVTAEYLYKAVRTTDAAVSLATIYNTLRLFCQAGLIREIIVDGGRSYFDTRTDDHPHFYWEDTGQLTDAPKTALKIENLPHPPAGAEIANIDVLIRVRKSPNTKTTDPVPSVPDP